MKTKIAFIFSALLLVIGLIACSDGDSADENSTSNNESTDENVDSEDEDIQESEIGTMTIKYKDKELNESAVSGPIELSVDALQVGELEVDEDYQDMFDGKEKVTVITFSMLVENSTDDTISIYPDQGIITTNTGEQIDADLFLSDSVGGEFIGMVKKDGEVFFMSDSDVEDIKEINLMIDAAHDEDYENVGDDIKMSFELN